MKTDEGQVVDAFTVLTLRIIVWTFEKNVNEVETK